MLMFLIPTIRQLVKHSAFKLVLEQEEKEAWKALKGIMQGFLGKKRGSIGEHASTRKQHAPKTGMSNSYDIVSHINMFCTKLGTACFFF